MSARYIVKEHQLPELVRAAYALSNPQGLGHLHFVPGPLDQEKLDQILSGSGYPRHIRLDMDYVRGRAVKLAVRRDKEGVLFIDADSWFDHSDDDLRQLAFRANLGDIIDTGA